MIPMCFCDGSPWDRPLQRGIMKKAIEADAVVEAAISAGPMLFQLKLIALKFLVDALHVHT